MTRILLVIVRAPEQQPPYPLVSVKAYKVHPSPSGPRKLISPNQTHGVTLPIERPSGRLRPFMHAY
jgi:hypothetical protein